MKKISLTQGKFALVDDEDYDELMKHKWCASKARNTFYAARGIKLKNGKHSTQAMHRQLMGLPKGVQIDHRDKNGINNQKSNLRIATCAQNQANSGAYQTNTSRYKGVHHHKAAKKWNARISHKGKRIHLGLFKYKKHAAIAYDKAAIKYHGEFAHLNFDRSNYVA